MAGVGHQSDDSDTDTYSYSHYPYSSSNSVCSDDLLNDDEFDPYHKLHPLLLHDIRMLIMKYGQPAISTRIFNCIDSVDVDLHIPLTCLEDYVIRAWNLSRNEPITIRLHIPGYHYLDAGLPAVEVFQKPYGSKFSIGIQLTKILQTFLIGMRGYLSNEYVKTRLSVPLETAMLDFDSSVFACDETGKAGADYGTVDGTNASENEGSTDNNGISQLVGMGFPWTNSQQALESCQGNQEAAVDMLVGERSPGIKPPEDAESKPLPAEDKTNKKCLTDNKSQKIHGIMFGKWRKSSETSAASVHISRSDPDYLLSPALTQNGKNAKRTPSLENGFLVQMFQYAEQRIPALNEFCVVCDEAHIFPHGATLKPVVCNRELCAFSFQELGVMADATDQMATGADVVDLLVTMLVASVKSERRNLVVDPFPVVVDPDNIKDFVFHPKKKDFDSLKKLVEKYTLTKKLTRISSGAELKRILDDTDRHLFPLLQWILSSNRCHIAKLPAKHQLKFMHTPHQFLLLSSPPAKETAFDEAKQKNGSLFAFHGSHIENWHSILHNGLIVGSGTKHQVHGAAYGPGIYLSPLSRVSFGYSGMGHGQHGPLLPQKQKRRSLSTESMSSPVSTDHYVRTPSSTTDSCTPQRFLNSDDLTCIALCEVVSTEIKRRHTSVWVCPNQNYVCSRFLFVYEDGQVGDSNIDTQQEPYRSQIINAMDWKNFCSFI